MGKFDDYINVTAPLHSATTKGKLGNANEIFLEGDTKNIENEIKEINSRHENLNKKHDALNSKHESLSKTVQGIATTGGASTATNVTYDNNASGLNAENTQDAIDELSSISHFVKRGGVVNISTNYNSEHTAEVLTLSQAIAKVPSSDRVLGFTMTFLSSDGWKNYQFTGTTINNWTDVNNWTSFVNDAQLKSNQDSIIEKLNTKVNTSDIVQQTGDSTTSVMSQKAVTDNLSDLYNKKLSKDSDSDSSISDSSEEFVVTDSKNKIAFKVDNEGTKVRVLNICDENGNVVKTITKELLDKIEILSQNSDKYGNTCKLQEKKGTYYEISAFSIKNGEQDLKAEFSTNKSKFGERTLHLYVHGKEETELTNQANRGTIEILFNTPIVVKESLSFWIYMPTKCFINHRFESIKNPDPSFYFVFSGNNFSESFKLTPQYSISPSWMLYKILNRNLREKEITKVSLSITTSAANPNMDAWIGCFVADQRFVPTINFNMDSKLSESVNSKFTDYLESNNVPANIMVRFGSGANSDGENIGRRLYFNGIVDAGVRNANVGIPTISDSSQVENINIMTCNYLKKVEGIRYYLENNIISNGNPTKPIISAHCATNYIDDVLAQALKTCGYRIIRHGNIYNYRSYIDSESCFIGTKGIGFNSTIQSVSDLTDEWKNNIEASFKEYVDNLIEWGMVGSFFTHEVKTREELAASWDSNAITVDVIEDCINYVLNKEKAGLIQFKTLDNIYYDSVGNDVYNN